MMKMGKLWLGLCVLCLTAACSDDDGRDDTVLDMSYITGKEWYYNGWLGSKYEYEQNDLLQVIRFEKDNTWKTIDYSGRQKTGGGRWEEEGNTLTLTSGEGNRVEKWNVLRSGNDYIQVNINAMGERSYTTECDWLQDLTADAFYVNAWEDGMYATRIGVDVRGNRSIREVAMITATDQYHSLENKGYYWDEGKAGVGVSETPEELRVRFYFRIGSGREVKLEDLVEAENMVKRTPAEVGLVASNFGEKQRLKVQWKPYHNSDRKVYYRVEMLTKTNKGEDLWFVSHILPAGTEEITLSESTGGEVNRLKEMKDGATYIVRLSAMIYEDEVDVNDAYSYANLQAKTCFVTPGMIWQ